MTTTSSAAVQWLLTHLPNTSGVNHRVTTLQTMWDYLTFPWWFAALHRGTRHVNCYSYHARTSVNVTGGGRNATVHDPTTYI